MTLGTLYLLCAHSSERFGYCAVWAFKLIDRHSFHPANYTSVGDVLLEWNLKEEILSYDLNTKIRQSACQKQERYEKGLTG